MAIEYLYDAIISHSVKDKEAVQTIAKRLSQDGLKIWLEEWQIQQGDDKAAKIEEGLQQAHVLILCMSENAFGAEWPVLESGTFRFRDPLNKDRRFVPLRLDTTQVVESMSQFSFISWLPGDIEREYPKLLKACRPSSDRNKGDHEHVSRMLEKKVMSLGHTKVIRTFAYSQDGQHIFTCSDDHTIRLWEVATGQCIQVLEGHNQCTLSVALHPDGSKAVSGSEDCTTRIWEIASGRCLHILAGHTGWVHSVAWSPDGRYIATGSLDATIRIWDAENGRCYHQFIEPKNAGILSVVWSADSKRIYSASLDNSIHLWDLPTRSHVCILGKHEGCVWTISFSPDGNYLLSGSGDNTVRIWEIATRQCMRVLKGHDKSVISVAWSPDGKYVLSGSGDQTIRLWDVESGKCQRIFEEDNSEIIHVVCSPDGHHAISSARNNRIRIWDIESGHFRLFPPGHNNDINAVSWSADGQYMLSCSNDYTIQLWETTTGRCQRVFTGHTKEVKSVAFSPDGQFALSGADDGTIRRWEVATGHCIQVLESRQDPVHTVTWSPDGQYALSVSDNGWFQLWTTFNGRSQDMYQPSFKVLSVAWSPDGRYALSGAHGGDIYLWEIDYGRSLGKLQGHRGSVNCIMWSPDGQYAVSGANDASLRLWDLKTSRCLRVLEGHQKSVLCVAWSPDGRHILSGCAHHEIRLWEVQTGRCLCVLEGHTDYVISIAWDPDNIHAYSAAKNGVYRIWDLSVYTKKKSVSQMRDPNQVQYTNAKVLLVGDSGVGKTGLSNYLALNIKDDERNSSTDGAWATHWKLPHTFHADGVEREIWLWDFAGQVDYRLVHQLFMDNTAAAVLVFNPQNENPFDGLGQWDMDLQKAARNQFSRLLAAGRIDRGGLVVSDTSINKFIQERGFVAPLFKTSAKTGEGCKELRTAIVNAIKWDQLPETTSPALYYRMKQEILALRNSGLVLIRYAELKQRMELALTGEQFSLSELQTVVGLLAGPGMIQSVDFGGFILLRPEVLSRYAAAVVRRIRKHPKELGCITEDGLMAGLLDYQDFERLPPEEEAVVLRILHETFVSRAWCLRQHCDGMALLTFPSYFRRERPEQPSHPHVLVTYRFTGPADDIYTTLVVRLHHTVAFETEQLWKFAADFTTQTGEGLGLKLTHGSEGQSKLEVYFNPGVDENSRLLFLRYVHNHLTEHAREMVRIRHYTCSNRKCDAWNLPFTNLATIEKALAPGGKGKIFCPSCGKPILLHDTMEQKFDSSEIKEQVLQMQAEEQFEIDNESKELQAVYHTGFVVAEAGQIYRGYTNSDHGIDGEIEFKDHQGQASGKRLYLQLKSGDSYLKTRQRDGAEIFQIKNQRWVTYWQQHAYPVMLVIRNSNGEIRWMNVSEYLRRVTETTKQPVKQITFEGERLDVMSVRRWRDKILKQLI